MHLISFIISKYRKIQSFILNFLLLFLLSNCAGIALTGAVATGVAFSQEKTVGDSIDDAGLWTKINNEMLKKDDKSLFLKVSVRVTEGRVLLTGEVDNPDARAEAVQIVWGVRGVKEVINELQIRDQAKRFPVLDYSMDTWITARIKGKLLTSNDIRSINYTIDTVNQVVYLMGIAQNEDELQKVNYLASSTKNVKKVISHVRIKDRSYNNNYYD